MWKQEYDIPAVLFSSESKNDQQQHMTPCSCKRLLFDWNEAEENGCFEKCFFILL